MRKPGFALTCAAIVVACGGAACAQPATTPPAASAPPAVSSDERVKRWTEDLEFLRTELPAKHKNAFFKCAKEDWEKAIARAEGLIAGADDARMLVEVRTLVARLGDGHTTVWADKESAVRPSRAYPFAAVWLADGIFVPGIEKTHAAMAGRRLVKIGGMPVEEAAAKVAGLRAHDNESGRKGAFSQDIREADSLVGLGVIAKAEGLTLTLADADGKQETVTLDPIPTPPPADFAFVSTPEAAKVGVSRRPQRAVYGCEVMAEKKTLYVWYDKCENTADKTVAKFIEETLAVLDAERAKTPAGVERVVVDLRRNGGGSSSLFMPMIYGLKERGVKSFALIGRWTFSSAMMNASQLRSIAGARLVGEPTGGTPNGYGEVKTFRLPNSKIVVQYSTKLFRLDKPGADAVEPDIRAEASSADYFSSGDAVLDAAVKAE